MIAARYTAPNVVEMVDAEPSPPSDGHVLVRTEAIGICGSDLHYASDCDDDVYPMAPGKSGHECVGIVESPGSTLDGRRFLVLPPKCDAFSEYTSGGEQHLIPVPEHVDPMHAVLAQQLGTVIYACKRPKAGRTAVVVGQGSAGLMFTWWLTRLGFTVVGLDIVQHRTDISEQLGAAAGLDARDADLSAEISELLKGPPDLVVEAVGKADTINHSLDLVKPFGEVLLFGVPKKRFQEVDLNPLQRKNGSLLGVVGAQREENLASFKQAMAELGAGRFPSGAMVSHRIPLAEAPEAFRLAMAREEGTVKVVLANR